MIRDVVNKNMRRRFLFIVISFILLFPSLVFAASLERIINEEDNIQGPYFTINENIGVLLKFHTGIPSMSGGINNSATLSLYLDKGENIKPKTNFRVYFISRNGVDEGGILLKVDTIPGKRVDFTLPLDIVKKIDGLVGFVIQPAGTGEFTFHGSNHWWFEDESARDKLPTLILTYTLPQTIKSLISDYFPLEQSEKATIDDLIRIDRDTNERVKAMQGENPFGLKYLLSSFIFSCIASCILYLLQFRRTRLKKRLVLLIVIFIILWVMSYLIFKILI